MRTSENYEQSYSGNNSTSTPYPINSFQFDDPADLEVTAISATGVETVLTPNSATITRDASTSLGHFTTNPAIPTTSTVKVARKNFLTQETDYIHSDAFPAESHERSLDRLIENDQYIRSIAQRALRVSSPNFAILPAAPVNNSVAGLDAAGQTIFRTAAELLSFMSLTAPVINQPTKTWANSSERAISVPDFLGQLGSQRDTGAIYVSTGLSAGSWTASTGSGIADNSITTAKLVDGVLSADSTGRAKMANGFVTFAKMASDFITAMAVKTLMQDEDYVAGWSFADNAYRRFPGKAVVPSGSVLQTVMAAPYFANTNITAVIPGDTSVPQITEGVEILTLLITPHFNDSLIRLISRGFGSSATTAGWGVALFRSPVSAALQACAISSPANDREVWSLDFLDSPATTSEITYTVRAGPASAGTIRMNGSPAANIYGNAAQCTMIAQEIKS